MGNHLKLNVVSLSLSIVIHVALLSVPLFKKALLSKTYQIVNAIPISFDTEVKSDLAGIKSVKGSQRSGGSRRSPKVPSGKRSAWENQKLLPKKVTVPRKGEVRSSVNDALTGKSGSYSLKRLTTGKGNRFVSLSVDVPGKRRTKELPSISYSRLVPYLTRVREKIMKNWTPPYYRSSGEKRKVTVSLKINRDGSIEEINIIKFSPDIAFNRSAVRAIYSSEPFEKFPKGVKLNQVSVKVNFEVR